MAHSLDDVAMEAMEATVAADSTTSTPQPEASREQGKAPAGKALLLMSAVYLCLT